MQHHPTELAERMRAVLVRSGHLTLGVSQTLVFAQVRQTTLDCR